MAAYGITPQFALASSVANNATFTTTYPTGTTQASLTGSLEGVMTLNDADYYKQGVGFTVAFGGSNTITVTNTTGYTIPAGTLVRLSFGNTARGGSYNLTLGVEHEQAKRGDL